MKNPGSISGLNFKENCYYQLTCSLRTSGFSLYCSPSCSLILLESKASSSVTKLSVKMQYNTTEPINFNFYLSHWSALPCIELTFYSQPFILCHSLLYYAAYNTPEGNFSRIISHSFTSSSAPSVLDCKSLKYSWSESGRAFSWVGRSKKRSRKKFWNSVYKS